MIRKRLRNRFGISAQRVAVRMHLPWPWLALSLITLVGSALVLGAWLHAAGYLLPGLGSRLIANDLGGMSVKVAQVESELELARKMASSNESRLHIELATQERLAAEIKSLEEENTRLKADLAMFESFAGGHASTADLVMSQLQIFPSSAPGEYRYRLMLVQGRDKKQQELKGRLQFIATMQHGTKISTMQFMFMGDGGTDPNQISFRYFRRFDGVFNVLPGAQLKSLEARFIKDGVIKASQTVML